MGTKLNEVPTTEVELNNILQRLFTETKTKFELSEKCNYTGLLEVIASEPNILTAIHKIKSNSGSKTPGVDGITISEYLERGYDDVILEIKESLYSYKAVDVKRVWIPKPGKSKKRPLGIPTIKDRIIQECVRNVIEPIAEAQFFEHSYGFRPMRSASMAVARIEELNFTAKCTWIVEGDIEGFFDNIDHNIMIKSLWNIGIRDKRVLSIIKCMLKAGVMEETKISEMGTPQGGIISPLLANIYLNRFDTFITREFEHKKLRKKYTRRDGEITSMRNHSNLKTAYYVRYADDWVIMTDNYEDAVKLKQRAKNFLNETLKLNLSEEKTLITNNRIKPIKFLGVEISLRNKDGKWVNKVVPDKERFDRKMKELKHDIYMIRKTDTRDTARLIENINRVNSKIVGILNYYQMCDGLTHLVRKYAWTLKYTAYKSLKKYGGKWIRARDTANLVGLHKGHMAHIPAIKYNDLYIGITDLAFAEWVKPFQKNQKETPYTPEGRELYYRRMRKRGLKVRTDEVNSNEHAFYIRLKKSKLYNFEYFMNRPYVYNRDKGKCKICGGYLEPEEAHFHHIQKNIPQEKINKASNLISVHKYCHDLIHSDDNIEHLTENTVKNVIKYRKKFQSS